MIERLAFDRKVTPAEMGAADDQRSAACAILVYACFERKVRLGTETR